MNQIRHAIPYGLGIKELKLESMSWTEFGANNTEDISHDQYEFTFNIQVKVLTSDESVKFLLTSVLFDKRELENKNEICTLKTLTVFQVANFTNVFAINGETIFLPDEMLELCAGIVVSIARGMFAIKLENTRYSNVILPLIDTKAFFPKKSNPSIA